MMHPEADSTLAKKLVGHKIKDITLGTYAGDADWEKKLGLMELVKYSREAAWSNTLNMCPLWPINTCHYSVASEPKMQQL